MKWKKNNKELTMELNGLKDEVTNLKIDNQTLKTENHNLKTDLENANKRNLMLQNYLVEANERVQETMFEDRVKYNRTYISYICPKFCNSYLCHLIRNKHRTSNHCDLSVQFLSSFVFL